MSYVYLFSGDCEDKDQLGNKGANLVTMTRLGLAVPPGFIVTIEAYKTWHATGTLPDEDIDEALSVIQKKSGFKLGKGLEVSVRSSAPVSMPGMMDTILNIGELSKVKKAIKKIFESWDNNRAIEYRRLNNISPTLGTAAVVQMMVYGNKDKKSGTGVVFSRNPSTGEKGLFGEYLESAQGEAVVSGSRTPQPVSSLKNAMPVAYKQLETVAEQLEHYFGDMQDIEYTVESEKLYILQTRSGKRSGQAAVKIAVDMVTENILTREEVINRVSVHDIQVLLHKQLKPDLNVNPIAKGLNAAPGAASGPVCFDSNEAVARSKKGLGGILVRPETDPDDIQGIAAAHGVLTQKGGLTSHAAIVTRAMGKPCISGAEEIEIDLRRKQFTVNRHVIKEGDDITIDGTTGYVYKGALQLEEASINKELQELLDDTRKELKKNKKKK